MDKISRPTKLLFYFLKFIFILVIIITVTVPLTANDDLYPSIVVLTIRSGDQIIDQDDFFEIIDQDEYILIPLSALSRYLEIELDYERENERLFVYYSETDQTIEIDFQNNNYPDFPEWNNEAPVILEGDFYVSKNLIEDLTGVQLKWSSQKQELILSYDDFIKDDDPEAEEEIRERPDDSAAEPDIKGSDFSLGSIQYNSKLDYTIPEAEEFSDGSLALNNRLYLHGRVDDWALSLGQNLNYNFQKEAFSQDTPLIRARNRENDRLIVLGDSSINLDNTAGRRNIRGIYFKYPHRQVRGENSYISVIGEAEEGSRVELYLNGNFLGEKYVYKGEERYHFSRVQLKNYRTNKIRIVIESLDGEKEEIVKEIAGSHYLFEENTNQGIFTLGKSREFGNDNWQDDLAGFQLKYAPSRYNSLSWELAALREQMEEEDELDNLEDPDKIINLGSLVRFAHRREDFPIVMNIDWLAGGQENAFEHGLRSRLMYTLLRGYAAVNLGYIPPEITDYVDSSAGGRAGINLQHEINNFWTADLRADTVRSIKDMSDLELYRANLFLRYQDRRRNSLSLSGEYATRDNQVYWEQSNLVESNRDWASVTLSGKTEIYDTDLSGELFYKNDWINFLNQTENGESQEAGIDLELNSRLTENLVAGANIETTADWFNSKLQKQDLYYNGRLRYRHGDNTFLTLRGFSERTKNGFEINDENDEDEFEENRREISLRLRHFNRPHLNLTGQITNTYLYLLDDDYFNAGLGLNYRRPEQDWEIDLDLGYNFPIGPRENSQEEINLKLTKNFDSGHEAYISAGREYRSIYAEEPSYKVSLGISQSLNFTKDKQSGEEYTGGAHHSYIGGVVYLDQDGTGVRNEGDPLLSNITMFKDGSRTETNEKGEFKFENVRSDIHEVGIELDNLDAKYNVVTEEKMVQIRENENIYLEFGLTMSGTISGRVYLDRNLSGSRDEEDENISMLGLKIEKLDETVYSDGEGRYYFDNIPLGQYTVKVLSDTIPSEMKLAGDSSFEVNIKEDSLDVRDLNLRLVYKTD
ncbi:MAG: hypothetical protein ACOCRV_00085 [bacterium]